MSSHPHADRRALPHGADSADAAETIRTNRHDGGSTLAYEAPEATQSVDTGSDGSVRRTFRGASGGVSAVGSGIGRAGRRVFGATRRITHAEGAGESGLAQVIELHAVSSAADMVITLSLANSLFFSVHANEARSNVALYLLITMVPFVLLAPVIGPVLDRLRGGRRYAIATTTVARALLAVVLARTLSHDPLAAYPAAFGCLAASKAYGVSRSSVMPRVLPRGTPLVRANSRATMASIVATAIATPIGGGLTRVGPGWGLGFAAMLFAFATVLALRLPKRVDSAVGELPARFRRRDRAVDPRLADTVAIVRLRSVGAAVLLSLRANAALRAFSGFLTIFLAFLLRTHPIGGFNPLVEIGAAAAAAGIGNAIGTGLGSWVKGRAPEVISTTTIALTTAMSAVAALIYGIPSVLGIAATIALAQGWGKLALDALIQRETPEAVRTSAFARSETVLQLCYVCGGFVGIAMPTNGPAGLGVASAGVAVATVLTIRSLIRLHRAPRPVGRR